MSSFPNDPSDQCLDKPPGAAFSNFSTLEPGFKNVWFRALKTPPPLMIENFTVYSETSLRVNRAFFSSLALDAMCGMQADLRAIVMDRAIAGLLWRGCM